MENEVIKNIQDDIREQAQLVIDQIEYVELEGWVRTNRDSGAIGFIELNDGTYFKNFF